jgi:nucleoside-diphosphate-sugar epimerase
MVYERQHDLARESDVPDMLVPRTDYGLSKLVGERLSQAFAAQYGLEYTIWRPFNIIGLHESAAGYDPGVCHVFADFIQRIVYERQNPMLVLGSGRQVRCFTWIGDVADAIAEWSFSPKTRNADFNLGNPEPVTMLALAARLYSLYWSMIGEPAPGPLLFRHEPAPADDVQVRIPEVTRAWERLGWMPKVSLDQMLRRCLEAALERSAVGAG